jgi:competence protein ComEC
MLTFLAGAPLMGRRRDGISALLGAGVLVLIFRPQDLFATGFQFTFIAVWSIVYLYPQLERLIWPWGRLVDRLQEDSERGVLGALRGYLGRYLLLSTCVWASLAPLTAYHYHHLSFLTPLINSLLWPVVAFLILGSFLLLPVSLVGGPLLGFLLEISRWSGNVVETILRGFSLMPGFVVYTAGPALWWLVAFYGCVCLWVVRSRFRSARRLFLVLTALLAIAHLCCALGGRHRDSLGVTVADVGHGQSVAFQLPSGALMLYDAGGSGWSRATAVEHLLWRRRVGVIETLVVSHRDLDHCAYVPYLGRRFRLKRLCIAPRAPHRPKTELEKTLARWADRRTLVAEKSLIRVGALRCETFHPNDRFLCETGLSNNERSLVLLCRYGPWKMLLTGDVGKLAMNRLVDRYGPDLRADVLFLPHHGHWEETLGRFVRAVNPRLAVASCGGRVDPRTKSLLQRLKIPLFTTAGDGAVVLRLDGKSLSARGYAGRQRMLSLRPAIDPN